MKKKKKFLLIIFVILMIGLALFGYIQRNNLKALMYTATLDQEQISQAIEDNEKELLTALGQEDLLDIELTEEQKIGITSGLIDPEELAKQIMSEKNEDSTLQNTDEDLQQEAATTLPTKAKTEQAAQSKDSEIDRLIAVQVSKMYVLKSSYIGQLEGLVQQAKSEFTALPEDQRTEASKQRIAQNKLSAAAGLEGSCDAQVYAVVGEIRNLLSQAGRDTSLANQISSAYAQEKSLKKAYYLGQIG